MINLITASPITTTFSVFIFCSVVVVVVLSM